jgi:pyrroloquinoline-quinone synthase
VKSTNRAPRVTGRAATVLERTAILRGPYLESLADGSMPPEVFRITQEQFFHAVTFFPRPMAALVGRIPDPHARLDILHNLVEEHGDFRVREFHHSTFRRFLCSIGSDLDDVDRQQVWPEVRAFNSVLSSACALDDLALGISCMGVIEYAFAGISAAIGRAVVDRGWVAADQLVHYKLHAAIDERHAEEFFAVVEPRWGDEDGRHHIAQGLQLGAYAFDRLYRDLYTRGCREARAVPAAAAAGR